MKYAQLSVLEGPDKGKSISVTNPDMKIGRGSGCPIRPEGYVMLGREHARLRWDNVARLFEITDLGSTNKVKVNGKIVQTAKLRVGDRVQLGDYTFELEVPSGGPEFGSAPPPQPEPGIKKPIRPGAQISSTSSNQSGIIGIIVAITAVFLLVMVAINHGRGSVSGGGTTPPAAPVAPQYNTIIQKVIDADGAPSSDESVASRVQRIKSISLNECPTDFKVAFQNYIHKYQDLADAQESMEALLKKQKDNQTRDTVDAISRWFKLDFTSKADELDAERQKVYNEGKAAYKVMKEAHETVEDLAVRYGATSNPNWTR